MMLNTHQLAHLLEMTPQGTRKLLKRLQAPLQLIHNKWKLNITHSHPICQSFQLQLKKPEMKAIYAIKELSIMFNKDKKTVLSLIRQTNLPLYGNQKKFILLYDLVLLQQTIKSKKNIGKRSPISKR